MELWYHLQKLELAHRCQVAAPAIHRGLFSGGGTDSCFRWYGRKALWTPELVIVRYWFEECLLT